MARLPIPFTFNQSSLQNFSECERRFHLQYIEQLVWPAVESEPVLENERSRIEGEVFHRLVQQFWLGLPTDKLAAIANASNLGEWWDNFIEYDFHLTGSKTYPELNLTMQIGKHRLIAKYDLVAVGVNKIQIFDWKTFKKIPREQKMATHHQTRVYRFLMVKAGTILLPEDESIKPDQVEMVYWLANFPNRPIHLPYSPDQFDRDEKYLERLIAHIESEEIFPLTPDEKKCNYCMYRSYCDRGIRASNLEDESESWEEPFDLDLDQVQEIEY